MGLHVRRNSAGQLRRPSARYGRDHCMACGPCIGDHGLAATERAGRTPAQRWP